MGFWFSPSVSTLDHYQPQAKDLGLIMGSQVDTSGEPKRHEIISNYQKSSVITLSTYSRTSESPFSNESADFTVE